MARYALVKSKKVINVVEWDGESKVNWGRNVTAVECPEDPPVNIGHGYADGKFIPQDNPEQ